MISGLRMYGNESAYRLMGRSMESLRWNVELFWDDGYVNDRIQFMSDK